MIIGGNWIMQRGGDSTGVGTYNLSGTGSIVGGYEVVGAGCTGTFTQSGGTNALLGGGNVGSYDGPGCGSGYYIDYDGWLVLGLYSGYNAKTGVKWNPSVGTYNLSGGLLTGGPMNSCIGGFEVIGMYGTGIFNQTGGTNNVTTRLWVGGGSGNCWAYPRLPAPQNDTPNGIYNLSGGLLVDVGFPGYGEMIGEAGTGIFTQTGGTNITISH